MSYINKSDQNKGLAKKAAKGGIAIAGGIGLFIINAITAGAFPFGLIIGGALFAGGILLRNRNASGDTALSLSLSGLGALIFAGSLPILGNILSFLITIGAWGLLIVGAIELFQVFSARSNKP